jgi:hypothetical protein
MTPALRLVVYDRTCPGTGPLPGLSAAWAAGSRLYRALGRIDAWHGVASWVEALDWLAAVAPGCAIDGIQYWGHGKWGHALAGGERLDRAALVPGHPLHSRLARLRERLAPGALFWFRTCETFGARAGHAFAESWSDFFGCRTAGHTYVIGWWQSGLHALLPGARAHWPIAEGLRAGSPEAPLRAAWSLPGEPNTITCLHGSIPSGWS